MSKGTTELRCISALCLDFVVVSIANGSFCEQSETRERGRVEANE